MKSKVKRRANNISN